MKSKPKLEPHIIGWVGIVDGRPHFDRAIDTYSELKYVPMATIYKTLEEARKRFEKTARVWVWLEPKKQQIGGRRNGGKT